MEVSVHGVLLSVSMLGMVSGICHEGTYGYECGYQCHCPLDKCNVTSGCSPGYCDTGWSGLTCNKGNIALNKPTSSSSVYQNPGNAVNGDNSANNYHQCFYSDWRDNSITEAWWRVDLGDMARIRHVTIYFRRDYKVRRNGIQIYIADTAASPTDGVNCHNVTGNRDGTDIPDVLTATCLGEGRYLVLYTVTVNNELNNVNVPMMDFCEVEVDVCSSGTFGDDCDNYCHCDGEVCDYVDGICPSGVCLPGWTTEKCDTVCEFGYYGANCRMACPNRNCKGDNSSCDRVTGKCDGDCEAGWNGTDCTLKCLRSYGDGCSKYCSDRKCAESSSDSCDHVSGMCENGCSSGWKGIDCTEACIQGIEYGANCLGNCRARKCEEGVDVCPRDTGICESGCQSGWKGQDCTQRALDDNGITHLSAGLLGALSMLVFMALVMGAVCLWRKKTDVKNGENKSSTSESAAGLQLSAPKTAENREYDAISGSQYATLDGRSPDMYESLSLRGVYSNSQAHI
ncbi:multiple epidermal growth factor-like domains protein 10 isoform X1 [Haliotis asinina]|uniref:multiple epidermal growth factor-like domains protein 10 isoform X1 n=1 Tax=Haliotis asinina TaxID=109174 RepID=UPI0035320323